MKPDFSVLGYFSRHVLSKTKSVTPNFFCLFGNSISLPFCVASLKKICAWELLGANVLKKYLSKFVDNWKHWLGLESAHAALCKWATSTPDTFVSKTFANSLNMQKQYEKNVWELSNNTYLLRIRVQTMPLWTTFRFVFCHTINIKVNVFTERELKEALHDKFTRAKWYGLLSTTAN